MRKTLQFATWVVVAGMTAHADTLSPEIPEAGDSFAVALAVINGEVSVDAAPDATAEVSGDRSLDDGQVSTFRIGVEGSDEISVSGDLSIGSTAVDTHVIEISANGRIKPGTYTLIDYEGSIGGAGFAGLSLRTDPQLHAELVNNTAESKIEVVVSRAEGMELASAVKNIWSSVSQSDWMLLPKLLQRPAQQVQ